jgi:MFS superfamily sulfate permease-like transporter
MVTILGIVFTDLLIGIGLGLAVAIMHILWHDYKMPYFFDPKKHHEGDPIRIHLAEHVTFINKAGILRTLDQLPHDSHVILDATKNKSMHPDVVEIIDDFCGTCKNKNITLEKIGFVRAAVDDQVQAFGREILKQPPKSKTSINFFASRNSK